MSSKNGNVVFECTVYVSAPRISPARCPHGSIDGLSRAVFGDGDGFKFLIHFFARFFVAVVLRTVDSVGRFVYMRHLGHCIRTSHPSIRHFRDLKLVWITPGPRFGEDFQRGNGPLR